MGQLIIPGDIKYDGPWLLDHLQLEELSDTITAIDEKLETAYSLAVEKEAEQQLTEYQRRNPNIDLEKAIQLTKAKYEFDKKTEFAILNSKAGKKLKDKTLLDLLKDPKIEDFEPTELLIGLEKGPFLFRLEVSSELDGELKIRTKVQDDNILNDINYEINRWANKYKPTMVVKKWNNWLPSAILPVVIILMIVTSQLMSDRKKTYQTQLSQQANEILQNGVSQEEITKSLEIMLQFQTDYIPNNFTSKTSVNKALSYAWVFAIIILGALAIKPKTTIGLGRNKWKIRFYRKWTYFLIVFVPLSIILPIVINIIT